MDGDLAPVEGLVCLCEKYGAHLIIDEAHAIGVVGDKGEGLVQKLGLQEQVFARDLYLWQRTRLSWCGYCRQP